MLWMVPQYSEFKAVGAVDPEGLFINSEFKAVGAVDPEGLFIIVSQDCPLKKKIFLHLPFPVSRMIFSYFSMNIKCFPCCILFFEWN